MVQAKTGDRADELEAAFEQRARANSRTVEQEVELLLARRETLTPEERVAVSRYFCSRYNDIQPSLTLEEIREGLE